jgi:1-acyl-sn-glycerol-3-phosphate acyltransferase
MFYLLARGVPRIARQQGIVLQPPIHSHFIYDRGMTIWAGNWLGWLFARLGGIPIHRGKRLDRMGLKAARNLLLNGQFPLAIAPEGATNGHSGIVSPLEPGLAQLALWCVEDLAKANRSEQVFIVPIAIQYRYIKPPHLKLNRLLSQLEADCGLSVWQSEGSAEPQPAEVFYQRLLRLAEHLLTEIEQFYRRFYPQLLAEANSNPNSDLSLDTRLQIILDTALRASEQYFRLGSHGSNIDRCRRIEEAGWNAIYREDLPNLKTIPSLQRGLADWGAEEASLRIRHMRLVESFVAVTENYIREKPTTERFAEIALIMFDLIARIKGKKIPRRPCLGWRNSRLTVGEAISVSDRSVKDRCDRQSTKNAVTDLTIALQRSLEQLIQ